jgi:hypothetical protein
MTVEARQTRDDADGLPARLSRLEGLAEILAQQGLRARLMMPPGRVPRLHVVNPAASALAEDIYVGRCQDGEWWFWWSWAERIASSGDMPAAATRIGRVLAIRQPTPPD